MEAVKVQDTEHVRQSLEFLKVSVKMHKTKYIQQPGQSVEHVFRQNRTLLKLWRIISFLSQLTLL